MYRFITQFFKRFDELILFLNHRQPHRIKVSVAFHF